MLATISRAVLELQLHLHPQVVKSPTVAIATISVFRQLHIAALPPGTFILVSLRIKDA